MTSQRTFHIERCALTLCSLTRSTNFSKDKAGLVTTQVDPVQAAIMVKRKPDA